jgi:hypothetical protein
MTYPPPQGPNPYAQGPGQYGPPPASPPPGGPAGYPAPPQQAGGYGHPAPPQQPWGPTPPQGPGPQGPYGGPPGPYGQPGPPGPPPQQDPYGGKKAYYTIRNLLLIALAIGALWGLRVGWEWLFQSDAKAVEVGDCVKKTGSGTDVDVDAVDCSSTDAQYRVAQVHNNSDMSVCDPAKYSAYQQTSSGGRRRSRSSVVLCLEGMKKGTGDSAKDRAPVAPTAYKLVKPDALLGGEYTFNSAKPSEAGKRSKPEIASDGKTVGAYYDGSGEEELYIFGIYGTIKDPKRTVDTVSRDFGSGVDAPPTEQTPSGFDGDAMKCGSSKPDATSGAYCVLGDGGTIILVTWKDRAGSTPPSPAEFAETANKVRNEIRVKK